MNYCICQVDNDPFISGQKYKFRQESYKKGLMKLRVYYSDQSFVRMSVEDFNNNFKQI